MEIGLFVCFISYPGVWLCLFRGSVRSSDVRITGYVMRCAYTGGWVRCVETCEYMYVDICCARTHAHSLIQSFIRSFIHSSIRLSRLAQLLMLASDRIKLCELYGLLRHFFSLFMIIFFFICGSTVFGFSSRQLAGKEISLLRES